MYLRCRALNAVQRVHFQRFLSTPAKSVIGLRKEDKNNWERRVPLAPQHVESLIKEGYKVVVESSNKRIFPDVSYQKAGAEIVNDLSAADIILGVKEVPVPKLLDNKTYFFFSHTHKGQAYNMPMLDSIIKKNIRLVDYELLTDEKGVRLVKFGIFAGYAGMIDLLKGLGQRLLSIGYSTPFINVGMSYTYPTLQSAKDAVKLMGEGIREGGIPKDFGPMTFVFTGDGHVSQGAQEIFKQLPHKFVEPSGLKKITESKDYNPNLIYASIVREKDYIVHKEGKPFDKQDYHKNPDRYTSNFHETIAPYTSVIVNGIYWESKYPRFLTLDQASEMYSKTKRLLAVGDISCDLEGSIQFTKKITTIDDPFFVYNPKTHAVQDKINSEGILVLSVDNLPAELAQEASIYFGNNLLPLIKSLDDKNNQNETIERASITKNGSLMPKFSYLKQSIEKQQHFHVKSNEAKKYLLLGSGMVAEPLVDYLSSIPKSLMTIGSISMKEAAHLSKGRSNITPKELDISNMEGLTKEISDHDVVISLVPAPLHPRVAKLCINKKKHMVTASYVSPQMSELDEQAKSAGITILNEIGLDPGIDHLSAIKIIDEVKHKGGKVLSFKSVCGGLPAPEASNNALGYKFSWSPRGVLSAGLNPSISLRDGKFFSTPAGHLFEYAEDINVYPGFSLECLPNRDSVKYAKVYGLDHAHTILRGTLRYKGFSELMSIFSKVGLFNDQPNDKYMSNNLTWRQAIADLLSSDSSKDGIRKGLSQKLAIPESSEKISRVLRAMEGLGLFSNSSIDPRSTLIDSFCALLQKELVFGKDERDMVILHHEFGIEWQDKKKEKRTSTLISYGTPSGYTAMAKTVGWPTAFAAEMLMDGTYHQPGVQVPMTKIFYDTILPKLEEKSIQFIEKSYSDEF